MTEVSSTGTDTRLRTSWALALTAATQLAGLALTVAGVAWMQRDVDADAAQRFERAAERIDSEVRQRFSVPLYGLMGARGAYAASGEPLGRDAFRAYVAARDLAKEFPGIRGFGFIQRVPRQELERFVAAERADGAPEFAVRSSGMAPDLYVVKHIEPLAANRAARGYDIGQEPLRRQALERAIQSMEPTLSAPITLVQDAGHTPGVLYLLPLFRPGAPLQTEQQKKDALTGLLYLPIVAAEMLNDALQASSLAGMLDFSLQDGNAGQTSDVLFDSTSRPQGAGQAKGALDPQPLSGRTFQAARVIKVGGRDLALRVGSTPAFDAGIDRSAPLFVGVGGVLASFLAALLVWLLASGRVRALNTAQRLGREVERLALVAQHTSNSDISARKQAEREIELREQRLRQLIDLVPHVIFAKDRQGRLLMANQALADFYQRPVAELIGMTSAELDGDAQVGARFDMQDALVPTSGRAQRFAEHLVRSPDGKERVFEAIRMPFRYSEEHPDAVLGVATDLTELVAAREAMRKSLALLEATLESTADGILVVDGDEQVLAFNQRFRDMWQLPVGLLAQNDRARVNAIAREYLVDPDAYFVATAASYAKPMSDSFDSPKFKDGRVFERYSRPLLVEGAAVGRVWSFRDISLRAHAEADLRASESQLRLVAESVPAIVVHYDKDLICRYANVRYAQVLGLDPGALVGRPMAELLGPRLMALGQDLMHRALAGETVRFEREHHQDASRTLDVRLVPYLRPDGVQDGYFGFAFEITERKLQEEALRRSLALLEATLEATADGILVMDGERRITRFNQRFIQMWGLPPDIAETREPFDLVDFCKKQLVDPAGFALRLAQIVADRKADSFDMLEFRDGRTWERQSRPQVVDGIAAGRVWSFRDVSVRAQAEADLRAREVQLRLVAESVPAIVSHYDKDLICRYANTWYEQALGVDPGALVGRPMAELLGPQRMALEQDRVHRVLSGETVRYEREHHQDTGRTLDVRLVPYLRPDGVQDGYFGFAFDISELKQAENQLRASERRLRAIIDNEPAGVTVANLEDRFLEVNAAGLAMLEAGSLAEAQARPIIEFVAPEHREAYVALGRRAMFQPVASLEFELIGLRGTRRWVETLSAPIRNEAGRITSMLGLTRDISAQKKIEAARASLESQLRESQKMQAMGTLAGGIAHDFNNIIAAILGNVTLAREDIGAGRATRAMESVQEIERAGTRARNLVQQILTFSRRQPSQRRRMALAPVLQEAARFLRASLPARLALSIHCDPQAPLVLADGTQIEQVLINLATNAMQAIGGASGYIEIRLDAVLLDAALVRAVPALAGMLERHPGPLAHLQVRDDGPGMDAATMERVFEPFFTTKPMGEGTGLGLSVVRGIVQTHEGEITLDSAPGKGACFTIYLPAAPEAQSAADLPEVQSAIELIAVQAPDGSDAAALAPPDGSDAAALASLDGSGAAAFASPVRVQKVMYVDDDDALVFLVPRLLERRGVKVGAYESQSEALAALGADPDAYDLLVSDYNMPGMSGLDVARQALAIRPGLAVALVSGFIDEALQERAKEIGVRQVIFKATEVEEFCTAILKLLADNATGSRPTPG